MSTLLCFHAHPDDEAIATGGTMVRARAEGHRVVLVVATDGAHGEVPGDLDRKRAALRAHASQVTDQSFFLQMPDEMFAQAFGHEWFIEYDRPVGVRDGWLFD